IAALDLFKTLLYTVNNLLNGAVYGAKIRAPNALVMTFLFRSGRSVFVSASLLQSSVSHDLQKSF
uniref:Wu:fe02h09 n=1 Tax=Cyprinus carpio TaxID=7962 RepID=A0A8C1L653_CYPCA